MANAKFADLVDPRLIEAAWHRFEAARTCALAARELKAAKEKHARAANEHMKAVDAYTNLEMDIARGVRMGAGQAA